MARRALFMKLRLALARIQYKVVAVWRWNVLGDERYYRPEPTSGSPTLESLGEKKLPPTLESLEDDLEKLRPRRRFWRRWSLGQ